MYQSELELLPLRLNCLYICGEDHLLYSLAKVPVSYDLVAVLLVQDDNGGEAHRRKNLLQFLNGNRSRNSAAVGIFILFDFLRKLTFLQDIGDCKSAARL